MCVALCFISKSQMWPPSHKVCPPLVFLITSLLSPPQLFYGEGEEEGERGEERVRLTRLYQFARRVRALLHTYHYHQIFLTEFPGAYAKFTGHGLQPRSYGYGSVDDLLNAIPQVQN